MITNLSPKQVNHVITAVARLNIADGPVRSGKTVANNVLWLEYIENGPPGALLMVGKTERTLKRNVLDELQTMLGKRMRYNTGKGEVYVKTTWGTRVIYVAGANDIRSEGKIRGSTLAGAYLNEISLYPQNFFDQVLARCSVTGARIFGDTNPDSPHHWLYTEYLSRQDLIEAGTLRRFQYRLDDNIFLDPVYVLDLKRLYRGLWHKRMILGLWVMAEGAIFDMWEDERHIVDELPSMRRYWVACDYGTTNAFVALLMGEGEDGKMYVCSEYRWDSKLRGSQRTDAQYSKDLSNWLTECLGVKNENGEVITVKPTERIFVDPSAASFIVQLHSDARHSPELRNVAQADNEVLDGIRSVSTLLGMGLLKVHSSCKGLIGEMTSYVWDIKAQLKGEDKPLKQDDHGPDALRYGINGTRTVWVRWTTQRRAA